MFLSVVILGRFTTETHAMALYVSIDTPPLLTPHPGTQPPTPAITLIPSRSKIAIKRQLLYSLKKVQRDRMVVPESY